MTRAPRGHHIGLVAVLALALLLRVVIVLRVADRPLRGDELSYDEIAWNVAQGNGYTGGHQAIHTPTALRGPGYVLPLALAYRVAGHAKLPVTLAQALLDTLTTWIVYRIARHVSRRRLAALLAALAYAAYPLFVVSPSELITETLVNATFLGALLCFAESEAGRPRLALAATVLVGVCALCKPQIAPVAVLFTLASRSWRTAAFWRSAAMQVAVVTLVLSPWIVRNAVVMHAFIPGVTNGGLTLWGGAGPIDGRTAATTGDAGVPRRVLDAIDSLGERERDRWLAAEGVRLIRAQPGHWVHLMGVKAVRLWFNLLYDLPPSRTSVAGAVLNGLAMLLAAWAVLRLRPPPALSRLLVGLVVYFTVVHAIFYAVVRYALPVYAYLFCFSAAAVAALVRPARPAANP